MSNAGPRTCLVGQGHRIFRFILELIVSDAEIVVVPNLPSTACGHGGFGHAGMTFLSPDSIAIEQGSTSA
eukprot:9483770-Pyramimonas_sp.AAC.1